MLIDVFKVEKRESQLRKVKVDLISLNTLKLGFHLVQVGTK